MFYKFMKVSPRSTQLTYMVVIELSFHPLFPLSNQFGCLVMKLTGLVFPDVPDILKRQPHMPYSHREDQDVENVRRHMLDASSAMSAYSLV